MCTWCRWLVGLALLVLLVGAAGCGRQTSQTATAAGAAEMTGALTYRERIALFPNAMARVELIATDTATGASHSLADTTLEQLTGIPIPFTLRYDRGQMREGYIYRVQARLLEPFGRTAWETPGEGTQIDPVAGEPVEILLHRIPDDGRAPTTTYFFNCDGLDVTVRVRGGEIGLMFPDTVYVLPQVPAASGAKYTEGNITFWTKGDEALLELNGATYRNCRSNPARAVWEDARLRGATLRAVGNEPGWSMTLYENQTPVYAELELDYGERRLGTIALERGTTSAGGVEYHAKEAAYTLSVVVERGSCADDMSGEEFDARVRVTVDEREYRGCGRYLQ